MSGFMKRSLVAVSCVALMITGLSACSDADPNVAACNDWTNASDAFNTAMGEGGIPTAEHDALLKSFSDGADSATGSVRNAFELMVKVSADSGASTSDLEGALGALGTACVLVGH